MMQEKVTIREIAQVIETLAPLHFQASYDNVGLLVGQEEREVHRALLCMDMTQEVIEEALDIGCELVISHHPLFFQPIQRLVDQSKEAKVIRFAIEQKIALYAAHTNLDHAWGGVNSYLASMLSLHQLTPLAPLPDVPTIEGSTLPLGAGIIGKLPTPMALPALLKLLQEKFQTSCIRYTKGKKAQIQSIALCGGSGSHLWREALAAKADAFITADIKYHTFLDAQGEIHLFDIGHYESEVGSKALLHALLCKKFPNIAFVLCQSITNPVSYHV